MTVHVKAIDKRTGMGDSCCGRVLGRVAILVITFPALVLLLAIPPSCADGKGSGTSGTPDVEHGATTTEGQRIEAVGEEHQSIEGWGEVARGMLSSQLSSQNADHLEQPRDVAMDQDWTSGHRSQRESEGAQAGGPIISVEVAGGGEKGSDGDVEDDVGGLEELDERDLNDNFNDVIGADTFSTLCHSPECVDRCAGEACSGHGACAGEACECKCHEGHTGRHCEMHMAAISNFRLRRPPKPCPDNCSGNGECQHNGTCICLRGWAGYNCSLECAGGAANPCSGHGMCNMSNGKCICDDGYAGKNCTRRTVPQDVNEYRMNILGDKKKEEESKLASEGMVDESQSQPVAVPNLTHSNQTGQPDSRANVSNASASQLQSPTKATQDKYVKGVELDQSQLASYGVNHAGFDMGSKALASNREAKGSSALLKNDRDKYWISPCKVEKGVLWVVIELSEIIHVHTIVLGSFEYYSSTVNAFQVLGGLVYPTDQWNLLGHFYASPSRKFQEFKLKMPTMTKYLKFRLLSHHGKEFYCTLSSIKVFGRTQWEEMGRMLDANEEVVEEAKRRLGGGAQNDDNLTEAGSQGGVKEQYSSTSSGSFLSQGEKLGDTSEGGYNSSSTGRANGATTTLQEDTIQGITSGLNFIAKLAANLVSVPGLTGGGEAGTSAEHEGSQSTIDAISGDGQLAISQEQIGSGAGVAQVGVLQEQVALQRADALHMDGTGSPTSVRMNAGSPTSVILTVTNPISSPVQGWVSAVEPHLHTTLESESSTLKTPLVDPGSAQSSSSQQCSEKAVARASGLGNDVLTVRTPADSDAEAVGSAKGDVKSPFFQHEEAESDSASTVSAQNEHAHAHSGELVGRHVSDSSTVGSTDLSALFSHEEGRALKGDVLLKKGVSAAQTHAFEPSHGERETARAAIEGESQSRPTLISDQLLNANASHAGGWKESGAVLRAEESSEDRDAILTCETPDCFEQLAVPSVQSIQQLASNANCSSPMICEESQREPPGMGLEGYRSALDGLNLSAIAANETVVALQKDATGALHSTVDIDIAACEMYPEDYKGAADGAAGHPVRKQCANASTEQAMGKSEIVSRSKDEGEEKSGKDLGEAENVAETQDSIAREAAADILRKEAEERLQREEIEARKKEDGERVIKAAEEAKKREEEEAARRKQEDQEAKLKKALGTVPAPKGEMSFFQKVPSKIKDLEINQSLLQSYIQDIKKQYDETFEDVQTEAKAFQHEFASASSKLWGSISNLTERVGALYDRAVIMERVQRDQMELIRETSARLDSLSASQARNRWRFYTEMSAIVLLWFLIGRHCMPRIREVLSSLDETLFLWARLLQSNARKYPPSSAMSHFLFAIAYVLNPPSSFRRGQSTLGKRSASSTSSLDKRRNSGSEIVEVEKMDPEMRARVFKDGKAVLWQSEGNLSTAQGRQVVPVKRLRRKGEQSSLDSNCNNMSRGLLPIPLLVESDSEVYSAGSSSTAQSSPGGMAYGNRQPMSLNGIDTRVKKDASIFTRAKSTPSLSTHNGYCRDANEVKEEPEEDFAGDMWRRSSIIAHSMDLALSASRSASTSPALSSQHPISMEGFQTARRHPFSARMRTQSLQDVQTFRGSILKTSSSKASKSTTQSMTRDQAGSRYGPLAFTDESIGENDASLASLPQKIMPMPRVAEQMRSSMTLPPKMVHF